MRLLSNRRLAILAALAVLAALVVVPVAANAGHDSTTTAKANLHPANQSGIKGNIELTDNGDGTWDVWGSATGMMPEYDGYVSLIYDRRSVPGGPGGPSRLGICEPTFVGAFSFGPLPGKPYPDIFDMMFVGGWVVDTNGDGELHVEDVELPPAGDWRTVSVRDEAIGDPPGTGPEAVMACGEVSFHKGSNGA